MLTKKASLQLFIEYETNEIVRLSQQIIENQEKIRSLKVVTSKKVIDAMYRLKTVGKRIVLSDSETNIWWQNLCSNNQINPHDLPLSSYYITEEAYRSPKEISYYNTIPNVILPEVSSHFPELIKFKQFNPTEEKITRILAQLKLRLGAKNLCKELEAILKQEDQEDIAEIPEFRRNIS
jgi:hypothetical protein